ncbi:MAG: peptidase U62 modulator of DNA gyrase [Elusimicrobia bacterium]|nr:MAG: peptidase U62 modulator of DNA gyrase [Elusimicrobiota bacterium]KAF0155797.1 MAG: peptidase U62 modulator of DNA gyrase [Elusimicrobiota bacterium]
MKEHKKTCAEIFRLAGRVRAEVLVHSSESALTRFADNIISQNVAEASTSVSIRLTDKGRVFRTSLNQPGGAALSAAVKKALAALKLQKKEKSLLLPPPPSPLRPAAPGLYVPATAALKPSFRAEKVAALARLCRARGMKCYGTIENGASSLTVANNSGVFASHRETSAVYGVTARKGEGYGWAEQYSPDASKIDYAAVGARAMDKAAASARPAAVPPGKYTVILEPAAVGDMLFFLGYSGLGGRAWLDGRSFASGALGRRLLHPSITITDDALEGPAAGATFDFEGLPRKKVVLIERGVARAVVHDRRTAAEAGERSTGHALPQPNTYGPMPQNLEMTAGDSSLDEMIRSTKKGILVTTFHYTNLLRPKTVEMTGMTRNGTFLVENGRVTRALKNMRFTQSVVEALNGVEALSRERKVINGWGRMCVPAMKIGKFNFSSATGF